MINMKKLYSDSKNWNKQNYQKSFENLKNDGYTFENIEIQDWFLSKIDMWKISVLNWKTAHKILKESEKAICFSVVNQYGDMYEMWFPKSTLISY